MKYIIIHVGTESIKDTQELAKHAQEIGATCLAVVCPVYYKPQCAGAMADYLEQVYKAAPRIPMLYYHIPPFTHVNFSLEAVFAAAQDKVPTLVGAKCSSPDLADVMRCLTVFKGAYQVLYGGDGVCM
ncbi:hypothetical protein QZH41_010844 [Actinostola sp. cb2023]|nr:hypothetical protein QZH41_010844 [Actinostola sp. cb2023]